MIKIKPSIAKKPALPANEAKTKLMAGVRNRCKLCGRGRAVYRKFGVCRMCYRKMASDGQIPGVRKPSW